MQFFLINENTFTDLFAIHFVYPHFMASLNSDVHLLQGYFYKFIKHKRSFYAFNIFCRSVHYFMSIHVCVSSYQFCDVMHVCT